MRRYKIVGSINEEVTLLGECAEMLRCKQRLYESGQFYIIEELKIMLGMTFVPGANVKLQYILKYSK